MAFLLLWSWPVYAFMPIQKHEVEVEQPTKLAPNVESIVKDYFKDIPVMVRIAKCESGYRQFHNGKVLQGFIDKDDTGVMQINKRYHLKTSLDLGFDINTLEGNLAYARHLYKVQGVSPWLASSSCWSK